jgi:putative oxidoreductase
MTLGTTLVRGVVGPLFVGHGTQKLFGWFGGHGIEGTGGYFESLGLRPGRRHATAAGVAETLGGALLTLGAATPVAASLISGTMVTAIRKAHVANGPWVTNGGYEYNLVIIAAMTLLAERGAGPVSVDAAVAPNWRGTTWATLSLGAALAGSFVSTSEQLSPGGEGSDEGSIDVAGDPAASDQPVPTGGS